MSADDAEPTTTMDRLTLRAPTGQLDAIDRAVDAGRYENRSAAIRDAIREKFMEEPVIVEPGEAGRMEVRSR